MKNETWMETFLSDMGERCYRGAYLVLGDRDTAEVTAVASCKAAVRRAIPEWTIAQNRLIFAKIFVRTVRRRLRTHSAIYETLPPPLCHVSNELRLILALRLEIGLTETETAELLRLSDDHVDKRLEKALKKKDI